LRNNLKNTFATAMPYVAVFGATGAAIYVFAKAYSAIKDIGNLTLDFSDEELDYGNDESLSKHFNKDQ
jgi:hypothetical protein